MPSSNRDHFIRFAAEQALGKSMRHDRWRCGLLIQARICCMNCVVRAQTIILLQTRNTILCKKSFQTSFMIDISNMISTCSAN